MAYRRIDMKLIVFCLGLFLALLANTETRLIRRPNGWFFTGRGCGNNEPYKFLSKFPEDTSGLTCTFIMDDEHGDGPNMLPCR